MWRRTKEIALCLLLAGLASAPVSRADTVASLLGNFTVNQYCGLELSANALAVHYVVVFGQLPALRELHRADTDRNGVTSQAEREAYVRTLVPGIADHLLITLDGARVPLHATKWTSSLPSEQGGFSLRVDVDLDTALEPVPTTSTRRLEFNNQNYPGEMGWHEIVVVPAGGLAVFDTNAFSTSLTGALHDALQALPAAGPLDERRISLSFGGRDVPAAARLLSSRTGVPATVQSAPATSDSAWIAQRTRQLIDAISGPRVAPEVALLALIGALLLGAVHALSPGHGKTIVGAYLIGSRGTPRHALFLGLTVTVTHTVGVFVLGFATLYASRFIVPERLFPILSLISAVLVLGMGVMLLLQRGRAAIGARARSASAPEPQFQLVRPSASAGGGRSLVFAQSAMAGEIWHSHGGGAMHSHLPPGASGEKITWRSLVTLGISGGLVPCPSALVLLLAAVALNKTAYGMLLVIAFSVGLAITLTLVGLAFLYAGNRFGRPRAGSRWTQLMPVLSAVAITVVGMALCFGALKGLGS
jgi:ABC-type nickel/cobalt efflux system permease component RcnA